MGRRGTTERDYNKLPATYTAETFIWPEEHGGFGSVSGKVEVKLKINHEGEVNR